MNRLEALLSSRVRARLLTFFFLSPGVAYHARRLAQTLGESYGAVWKELARLERMGILSSEPIGNIKSYRVNPACPIAPELRSIVLKTAGVGDTIRRELAETHGVKEAFIYGSYASGEADERSDLDLLVIGEVDLPRFASLIAGLEKQLNRPINYVIASQQEWNEKLARKDPFATNVTRSPKIPLIGEDDAL